MYCGFGCCVLNGECSVFGDNFGKFFDIWWVVEVYFFEMIFFFFNRWSLYIDNVGVLLFGNILFWLLILLGLSDVCMLCIYVMLLGVNIWGRNCCFFILILCLFVIDLFNLMYSCIIFVVSFFVWVRVLVFFLLYRIKGCRLLFLVWNMLVICSLVCLLSCLIWCNVKLSLEWGMILFCMMKLGFKCFMVEKVFFFLC